MNNKVYIGNLSYDTTDETLRNLFQENGEVVSVNVITDRFTGSSRGFAFVEMSSAEEAQASITALDGKEVDGRNLKVSEAREKRSNGFRR